MSCSETCWTDRNASTRRLGHRLLAGLLTATGGEAARGVGGGGGKGGDGILAHGGGVAGEGLRVLVQVLRSLLKLRYLALTSGNRGFRLISALAAGG